MRRRAAIRYAVLPALFGLAAITWALHGAAQPAAQSFAARIERLSEAGGDFDTDNLISNERSYLEVVPALKSAGSSGGAYIGVGPDQNFSYIAQLRPSIAFIVDIRRDNLLLHLLFKALFAASRTRVEYLALLTGRPPPDRLDTWRDASLDRIVAYIDATKPDVEASQQFDRKLYGAVTAYGVTLNGSDGATLQRFHQTFVTNGLSLKFESRGRPPQRAYPTFRDLLVATDRTGASRNFLASEGDFQFVRSLEARDLIIPVVGDLGGTHALTAIADLMTASHERLSAFYISNVETYLSNGKYTQFVKNVSRLPHDAHSVIIRSTFQASISSSEIEPVNQFVTSNR
jgi:hypothetical protein